MDQAGSQDQKLPAGRAEVERKDGGYQQLSRKYDDTEEVRKRDEDGIFGPEKYKISSGRYDNTNHRWMYKLTDGNGDLLSGEVPENQLG
ncbi:hypothetical protein ACLMJK_006961 [Lecanora helva]